MRKTRFASRLPALFLCLVLGTPACDRSDQEPAARNGAASSSGSQALRALNSESDVVAAGLEQKLLRDSKRKFIMAKFVPRSTVKMEYAEGMKFLRRAIPDGGAGLIRRALAYPELGKEGKVDFFNGKRGVRRNRNRIEHRDRVKGKERWVNILRPGDYLLVSRSRQVSFARIPADSQDSQGQLLLKRLKDLPTIDARGNPARAAGLEGDTKSKQLLDLVNSWLDDLKELGVYKDQLIPSFEAGRSGRVPDDAQAGYEAAQKRVEDGRERVVEFIKESVGNQKWPMVQRRVDQLVNQLSGVARFEGGVERNPRRWMEAWMPLRKIVQGNVGAKAGLEAVPQEKIAAISRNITTFARQFKTEIPANAQILLFITRGSSGIAPRITTEVLHQLASEMKLPGEYVRIPYLIPDGNLDEFQIVLRAVKQGLFLENGSQVVAATAGFPFKQAGTALLDERDTRFAQAEGTEFFARLPDGKLWGTLIDEEALADWFGILSVL